MQQQQQHQQQQVAKETSCSSLVTEDPFDAIRQAATNMFKQRTKDLTRLSALQEQHDALEQQLSRVGAAATQTHAIQAEIESSIQTEEQRMASREAEIKSLKHCMRELEEEENLIRRVHRSTDKVAQVVHQFLGPVLTSADSTLMRLLDVAQRISVGRTAGDFRNLAAEVRRRSSVLRNHLDEMQRTGSRAAELKALLKEWARCNWTAHKELREACYLAGDIVSLPEKKNELEQGGPLSDGPLYPVALDEDALFDITPDQLQDAAAMEQSAAELRRRVLDLVALYTTELDTFIEEQKSALQQCEELGVNNSGLNTDVIEGIRHMWSDFTKGHEAWLKLCAQYCETVRENRKLEEEVSLLTRTCNVGEDTLAEQVSTAAELQSRHQVLEADIDCYAKSWQSACSTAQAQASRLTQLDEVIATTSEKLHQAVSQLATQVEQLDADTARQRSEADKGKQALTQALDALKAAEAQWSDSMRDVQAQEARLALVLSTAAQANADGMACLSAEDDVPATPEDMMAVVKRLGDEWVKIAGDAGTTVELPNEETMLILGHFIVNTLRSWDATNGPPDALRAALSGHAALEEVVGHLDDEVLHTAMVAIKKHDHVRRLEEEEDALRMKDANQEINLLRGELGDTDDK